MNLTDFSLRNRTLIVVLTLGALFAGYQSFNSLPRLEDPEFTIKEALVITPYPGATPYEVEEEVSDELERAVQQLGKIKKIESRNIPGQSTLSIEMRSTVPGDALPPLEQQACHAGADRAEPDQGDFGGFHGSVTFPVN